MNHTIKEIMVASAHSRNCSNLLPEPAPEVLREWLDAVDFLLGEIERIEKQWISVDDRLPEENGEYLCRLIGYDDGEVFHEVGAFNGDDFDLAVNQINDRHVITHWNLLPPPPE